MTQEQKDLLLKDLCARLPYGVILNCCEIVSEPLTLISYKGLVNNDYDIDEVKPYLFPLSSMTEEQKHELKMSTCPNGTGYFNEYSLCCPVNHFGEEIPFDFMSSIIDYLNKNHFDYHGLIEKGLAIDATSKNIY